MHLKDEIWQGVQCIVWNCIFGIKLYFLYGIVFFCLKMSFFVWNCIFCMELYSIVVMKLCWAHLEA